MLSTNDDSKMQGFPELNEDSKADANSPSAKTEFFSGDNTTTPSPSPHVTLIQRKSKLQDILREIDDISNRLFEAKDNITLSKHLENRLKLLERLSETLHKSISFSMAVAESAPAPTSISFLAPISPPTFRWNGRWPQHKQYKSDMNPSTFVRDLEAILRAHSIPEHAWTKALSHYADKYSRYWIDKHIVIPQLSWTDGKKAFIQEFLSDNLIHTQVVKYTRLQQTSAELTRDFALRFQMLAEERDFNLDRADIICEFFNKLRPTIANQALHDWRQDCRRGIKCNWRSAVSIATAAELLVDKTARPTFFNGSKRQRPFSPDKPRCPNHGGRPVNHTEDECRLAASMLRTKGRHPVTASHDSNSDRKRPEHTRSQQRQRVTCHRCGRPGHKQDACYAKVHLDGTSLATPAKRREYNEHQQTPDTSTTDEAPDEDSKTPRECNELSSVIHDVNIPGGPQEFYAPNRPKSLPDFNHHHLDDNNNDCITPNEFNAVSKHDPDRIIIVPLLINGTKAKALVDCGCDVADGLINADFADRMKLPVKPGPVISYKLGDGTPAQCSQLVQVSAHSPHNTVTLNLYKTKTNHDIVLGRRGMRLFGMHITGLWASWPTMTAATPNSTTTTPSTPHQANQQKIDKDILRSDIFSGASTISAPDLDPTESETRRSRVMRDEHFRDEDRISAADIKKLMAAIQPLLDEHFRDEDRISAADLKKLMAAIPPLLDETAVLSKDKRDTLLPDTVRVSLPLDAEPVFRTQYRVPDKWRDFDDLTSWETVFQICQPEDSGRL